MDAGLHGKTLTQHALLPDCVEETAFGTGAGGFSAAELPVGTSSIPDK